MAINISTKIEFSSTFDLHLQINNLIYGSQLIMVLLLSADASFGFLS